MENNEEVKYDFVNHTPHYNNYDVEVIDMIERIWGAYAAAIWCEITAYKYRQRLGLKPTASISEDLEKEKVYLEWYKKYRLKWENDDIDFNNLTEEEKRYIRKMSRKIPVEDILDSL